MYTVHTFAHVMCKYVCTVHTYFPKTKKNFVISLGLRTFFPAPSLGRGSKSAIERPFQNQSSWNR